jgi:putative transposase
MIPTHFTINYIYREYHLTDEDIKHSQPAKTRTTVNLFKIYNSEHVLGLILSFYISYALSARKTALILHQMFKLEVSHQTVLNYARAAAYYCHRFNLAHKGPIDDISAGDETYIRVKGKNNYIFFFISSKNKAITAYHFSHNRDPLAAIAAMKEAVRTAKTDQDVTLITDGNPSYAAALHFLNQDIKNKIKHIKVIGLENLDEDSEEYREFKQIIERLNRTYKQHVRPSAGFNSDNGAIALTTLFVTHYNFLRPHSALKFNVPVILPELDKIDTIQARWVNILKMAV